MRIFPVWQGATIAALALFVRAAPPRAPVDDCQPAAAVRALSPDWHTGIKLSEPDRSDKIAKIREALGESHLAQLEAWLPGQVPAAP